MDIEIKETSKKKLYLAALVSAGDFNDMMDQVDELDGNFEEARAADDLDRSSEEGGASSGSNSVESNESSSAASSSSTVPPAKMTG